MSNQLKLTRQEMATAVGPEHNAIVQFEELFIRLGGLPEGEIWIGDTNNTPQPQTVTGDVLLDLSGVTTLQETPNVINIVNDIVSDSGSSILANNIFGRRPMQAEPESAEADFSSDQNILSSDIFGHRTQQSEAASVVAPVDFSSDQNILANQIFGY